MFESIPYSVIVIFQGLCVLHVLKCRRDYKWFWIIVFIPLFGCIAYFFFEILPGLRGGALPEFDIPIFQKMKMSKAEKELKNCDSLDNRVTLAELYAKFGRSAEAIHLIQNDIVGVHKDSPYFLYAYALILFGNHKYDESLDILDRLGGVSESVRKKERKLLRGRIKAALNQDEQAECILKDACKGFDGEEARYWYARQLVKTKKFVEAVKVADEGIDYYKDSESLYRRQERAWYKGLKSIRAEAIKVGK
jgi:hypothetical protein